MQWGVGHLEYLQKRTLLKGFPYKLVKAVCQQIENATEIRTRP